jgi:hypothetical protein
VPASGAEARVLALALPGACEKDHMGSPSFRVGDKIFAQLSGDGATLLVKMPREDQLLRLETSPETYSVPDYWSKFGWTYADLRGITTEELRYLLARSWSIVTKRKLPASHG